MEKSSRGLVLVAATLLLSAIAVVACSSDDGEPSGSTGTNVDAGGTTASADGGAGGGDGGGAGNGDGGGAGKGDGGGSADKDLGEPCTKNEDCQSNECFVGGKESYCSLRCTAGNAATVCVAPFAGQCNNQGYCRKP